METITRSILRKQEIGSTDCNLTSCTKNGHNKERIKKKCMQFLSRLEGIPTSVRYSFPIFVVLVFLLHYLDSYTIYYMCSECPRC